MGASIAKARTVPSLSTVEITVAMEDLKDTAICTQELNTYLDTLRAPEARPAEGKPAVLLRMDDPSKIDAGDNKYLARLLAEGMASPPTDEEKTYLRQLTKDTYFLEIARLWALLVACSDCHSQLGDQSHVKLHLCLSGDFLAVPYMLYWAWREHRPQGVPNSWAAFRQELLPDVRLQLPQPYPRWAVDIAV